MKINKLPGFFPLILLFLALLILPFNIVTADDTEVLNRASITSFDYWKKTLSLSQGFLQKKVIQKTFSDSEEILPIDTEDLIYGLALSGTIQLRSVASLVRVTLIDENYHEYLIYEAYPLIVINNLFSITEACEETCQLDSTRPRSLRIELIDASIHIDEVSFSDTPLNKGLSIAKVIKQIKSAQDSSKIALINEQIKKQGLKWIAGETSISRLAYEEKKKMFGGINVPNLQGAEYYRGGIFKINSNKALSSATGNIVSSSLIETFDWRNRHNANNPGSPYYDGDQTGSGWLTPVKSQGSCGDCWAFSAVGATESCVNLYFNQHLDLDLSEEELLSCGFGSCGGGLINRGMDYIINNGIVDEGCFPYSASKESCDNKCSNPTDHIKIEGIAPKEYEGIKGEENLKTALIGFGPLACGVLSWNHGMTLVGFDKDPEDGQTIWIFKNSYGTYWGQNGYAYIKTGEDDLFAYAVQTPIYSIKVSYEIACYDKDGDGYFNWGISLNKPPACPSDSPEEEDCDDSNPNLGPIHADGRCTLLTEAYRLSASKPNNGIIKSIPWGIDCGMDCSEIYSSGANVTLAPTPDSGYLFSGWEGCDSASDDYCYVTINQDRNITAHFGYGPDFTGKWILLDNQCKNTKKGLKCKIKGKFVIQNNGNQDARSSSIRFYLSNDNIYDGGDTLLKKVSVAKIKTGRSTQKSFSYSFPYGASPSGKYIIAIVDADNIVAEVRETNNNIVFGPLP
jgi:C1A family cysteine protease